MKGAHQVKRPRRDVWNETPPYSVIAPLYDRLLGHVDYQEWYSYIRSLMLLHTRASGLVVELGCGTGIFTARFASDGHRVLGIDRSLEMLTVARRRMGGGSMHLCCADITSFSLAGKAEFIYCIHDTVNYLLGEERVRAMLRCAGRAMTPASRFLFDITTEYNVERNFNNRTNVFRLSRSRVEWRNDYDPHERLITSRFEILTGTERFVEVHRQKIYRPESIERILDEEGFRCVAVYGDNTFDRPNQRNIMVNYLVRLK